MTDSRRLLAIVVLVVTGAACAGVRNQPASEAIEIEMEIGGGQRWSASGDPVESGSICEGGSHRWVGYRRQDGSAVAYEEAITLAQPLPEWVLLEMQLGCSDGTGAISIAWEPDAHDRWMVVGGIGAYSAATGGGHVERSAGRPAGAMILSGEISTG